MARQAKETGNKLDAVRAMASGSLLAYSMVHSPKFKTPRHIQVLAKKLEDAEARTARGETVRLQVMMPPQNGKSTITSEFFVAWLLGKHPDWPIAYGTYNADFAAKRGRTIRNLLSSPLHKAIFPKCTLASDSQAADEFKTTQEGGLKTVGRGGGLTGYPVRAIVIDDPFKDMAEADSPTIREAAKNWYNTVIKTRLKPGDLLIIINTRWHVDDLSGYTLREHAYENWEVVSFPAIDQDGQALWPEVFPVEYLLNIKSGLPPRQWAALYQQSPIVEDGNLINPAWFRRYTALPSAPPDYVVQSWDVANKKGDLNDYSVCETWAVHGPQAYLVDVFRKRLSFPELKKAVVAQRLAWGADLILMEDKANGIGLLQELKETSTLPLVPIDPGTTPKELRMSRCTAPIEGGQVFIPEDGCQVWLTDFVVEAAAFPAAEHDDQVDSMSQFLDWFMARNRRSNFFFKGSGRPRNSSNRLMDGYTL